MEVTIGNHCDSSFSVNGLKKDKAEFGETAKFSTRSTKEAMTISKAGLI